MSTLRVQFVRDLRWLSRCAPVVALLVPAMTASPQAVTCQRDWVPTFGASSGTDGEVYCMQGFDDGSGMALYVGGSFASAGGVPAHRIARWDGTEWSGISTGMGSTWPLVTYVQALAVFDDGNGEALYVAGAFASVSGVTSNSIARWDGTNWTSLSTGLTSGNFYAPVDALAVFDDGTGPALYAAGGFVTAGGVTAKGLAKWNGSSWSAVGGGLGGTNPSARALAVYDDGSGPALCVAGFFTSAGGVPVNGIAKWDGANWTALGSGFGGTSPYVTALEVYDSGGGAELYAGGEFNSAGGVWAHDIARWNGTNWSPLTSGVDQRVQALEVFDDGTGAKLYAGGSFIIAGGLSASRIASWDGSNWAALSGMSYGFDALTVFDDGNGPMLYAGGDFPIAGGIPAENIARWNGSAWSALGSGLSDSVQALAVFEDAGGPALIAGGKFTTIDGQTHDHIARWRGGKWSSLGLGTDNWVETMLVYDDGTRPALYVGGSFVHAGGINADSIAKWNGTQWSSLGAGIDGIVFALAGFDDGNGPALYAGGYFSLAGGAPATNIAKWDGTNWTPLGTGTSSGPQNNAYVLALAVFDDGSGPALYAGGMFDFAGNVTVNHVAKWDGANWSALGSGTNGYEVDALAVFDDGTGPALYAGGIFTQAGGIAANRVAKWDGSSWSPLDTGMNAGVSSLLVFDDGTGPALYAGGGFTVAGGVAASNVAMWNGASWSPLGGGMISGGVELCAFDDGTGTGLYAGGDFHVSAAGDSYLAKWGCAYLSSGASYCTAGTTTHGCVPAIGATGNASSTANSGFTISVSNVEGQRAGIFFYGIAGPRASPWSAGSSSSLCVQPPTQRMGVQSSGGTAGACDGTLSEDWNAYIATHPSALGQPFSDGHHVWAQAWFRDPPAPKTTNLSNGLVFLVGP